MHPVVRPRRAAHPRRDVSVHAEGFLAATRTRLWVRRSVFTQGRRARCARVVLQARSIGIVASGRGGRARWKRPRGMRGRGEFPSILIAPAAGRFLDRVVGLATLEFRIVAAALERFVRTRVFVEGRILSPLSVEGGVFDAALGQFCEIPLTGYTVTRHFRTVFL